jgi:imidazole glycerol-phosphate synthase subunit HisH
VSIAVVDYGMGNLRSVTKAMEHVADGQKVIVTSSAEEIQNADRVVFPGQGAARDCMKELSDRNLNEVVLQAAKEKPFLGICMGMQVLLSHSQENSGIDCLGLYAGEVRAFDKNMQENGEKLKIPHMGWNQVHHSGDHALWHKIGECSRFYFVHSYYMDPEDQSIVSATTEYGIKFVSGIGRDNVFAVQFHPEKSAAGGLQLLKNFAQWNGQQ